MDAGMPKVLAGDVDVRAQVGGVQVVVRAGKDADIEWHVSASGTVQIVLEKDAKAHVRIIYAAGGEIVQEIQLGEQAECTLTEYGAAGKVTEVVHCGKASRMQHTVIAVPTAQASIMRTYFLEQPRASVVDHELVWVKKQGVHEQNVRVVHLASHTTSQVKVKEIMQDAARSKMHGLVRVEKDALHVSSFLEAHALLLNKGAVAQIIPALEIETSEVQRAGHATTVSPLDEEQLFYLTARGMDEADARRMLIQGFVQDALSFLSGQEQAKVWEMCEN